MLSEYESVAAWIAYQNEVNPALLDPRLAGIREKIKRSDAEVWFIVNPLAKIDCTMSCVDFLNAVEEADDAG